MRNAYGSGRPSQQLLCDQEENQNRVFCTWDFLELVRAIFIQGRFQVHRSLAGFPKGVMAISLPCLQLSVKNHSVSYQYKMASKAYGTARIACQIITANYIKNFLYEKTTVSLLHHDFLKCRG